MQLCKNKILVSLMVCQLLCAIMAGNAQASFPLIFPETGSWFNRDANDKTGLNLEIQDGVLSGAYYGYNGNGDQVWLLFSGQLSIDQTGHFIYSGELTRSTGGGCIIDCDRGNNNGGHSIETVGTIDIEFDGRSAGRFRVNDNDFQPISPLSYGNRAEALFEDFPDQLLPDFQGRWAVEYTMHSLCSNPQFATVLNIFERQIEDNPARVTHRVDETQTVDPIFVVPDMQASVLSQPKNNPLVELLAGDAGNGVTITPQCTPPVYTFFASAQMVCEVIEDEETMPVCMLRANQDVPREMQEFMFKFVPNSSSDSGIQGEVLRRRADNEDFFGVGSFRAWRLYYD